MDSRQTRSLRYVALAVAVLLFLQELFAGRCAQSRTCREFNQSRPARGRLGTFSHLASLTWLVAFVGCSSVNAQEPGGREILDRVERLLWGTTVQGDYEMTISTSRWQRTLGLRVWMERPRRSFVRIVSPAKEAGIGSLRLGSEMWNYLPNVERVVKIPPSMMLQPWMGSDFTNDDLVKQSSILEDYRHKVLATVDVEGQAVYQVEAVAKPDAAVVWGRIIHWVRKTDFLPLKQEFYDERGELMRTMTFSEVRIVGDRRLPTRWEMRPQGKAGNVTTIVLKNVVYDAPIDADVFSQRHLRTP